LATASDRTGGTGAASCPLPGTPGTGKDELLGFSILMKAPAASALPGLFCYIRRLMFNV